MFHVEPKNSDEIYFFMLNGNIVRCKLSPYIAVLKYYNTHPPNVCRNIYYMKHQALVIDTSRNSGTALNKETKHACNQVKCVNCHSWIFTSIL